MMKVTLDHEGCIGCGLCVSTCPAVFGLAADGKAEVVQTPISEEEKDGPGASAVPALWVFPPLSSEPPAAFPVFPFLPGQAFPRRELPPVPRLSFPS